MRYIYLYGALSALMLAACGQEPVESPGADAEMQAAQSTESGVADDQNAPIGRLGSAVVPSAYRLELKILPDQDDFSGITEIDIDITAATRSIYLHGNGLVVENAHLTKANGDSYTGSYRQVHETGVARIDFDDEIPAGAATLRISYTAPFQNNSQGLYKSTVADIPYTFTQFEPISARRVFPGFDEPLFKVPFDISVVARNGHTVVTNTLAVETQPAGDGLQRIRFATTKPLPTYLLAFAVGELDVVDWQAIPPSKVRSWPLPLRGIATKGEGARMQFALENTAQILTYLEEYFDTEYPYAKLDLISSPEHSGAMENAGAIVYASAMILLDDNASVEQLRRLGAVHAHEIAHHWFGDLVTPKWWDDIWLNESFANWMSFKAAHDWRPDFNLNVSTLLQSLAIMGLDSRISARRIRNPVDNNDEIGSAFDGITYLKGGGVLEMFESYLGEQPFREGIRTHIARFPHGVADVEDFMSSLADGSKRPDIITAFRSFIDQAGIPIVGVATSCAGDTAGVTLTQSRYLPLGSKGDTRQTWEIPLCMSYEIDGRSYRQCSLLTEASVNIDLEEQGCPSYVMPNANGAGYYRFSLDDAGWLALMQNLADLSEREALATADSLTAAYEADRVSTETLMGAYQQVAQSLYRAVTMMPSSKLKRIRDDLANAETAAAIEAFMRSLYQPRLAAIGMEARDDESVDAALLRGALVNFLAMEANDTALRAILAGQASAYIRMGEDTADIDKTAIDPAFTAAALSVAVQDLGASFAKTLFDRLLSSDDARFREQASAALGNANDAELAEWVRQQSFDERLKGREPTNLIFGLASTSAERRATFDWFKANREEFIELVPVFARRFLPNIGSGFCTLEERDEVTAVFATVIEQVPSAARANREALEKIELCAALADTKRGEVAEYFGQL
jgi:alanyl aminopeptidase